MNATRVLAELFPQLPPSLTNVQVTAYDGKHQILRLTGEAVTDGNETPWAL